MVQVYFVMGVKEDSLEGRVGVMKGESGERGENISEDKTMRVNGKE